MCAVTAAEARWLSSRPSIRGSIQTRAHQLPAGSVAREPEAEPRTPEADVMAIAAQWS